MRMLGACPVGLIGVVIVSFNSLPVAEGSKRTVVISGAGDRRDQDIREQTTILGAAFDNVVLYEDACQRGRAEGEVIGLLRQGLNGASRTVHVEEVYGEFLAIDRGLALLNPGDQCLVLVDQVEEALAYLHGRIADEGKS